MDEPPRHLPLTFSRILCALDLKGGSPDTLRWAAQFADQFHARLGIVHALGTAPSRVELQFARDWKTAATDFAREELKTLQADAGADAADVFLQEGETAKTVSSFAKSTNADLLIIGRGSQEGPGGRLGKNAYAIIRESPCPVVSV
jgi:nucleotide-binding universal stress UspA family protein